MEDFALSELEAVSLTRVPLTATSLADKLRACGLTVGQHLLLHSSMSKMGWIAGGAEAVILAFLEVLGSEGTLMMPTHSTDNTDPAGWINPPVPESWWPIIRQERPPYNPSTTPTRMMGRIPELFRTWPGTLRSAHPVTSFAAQGRMAGFLTADHVLEEEVGQKSPLGKLYDLDGHVLLLGVGHMNNTSLHLAEFWASFPGKKIVHKACAMIKDGERRWVDYESLDLDDHDFSEIGAAFEGEHDLKVQHIGKAEVRFFRQRALVDFAVKWMEENRR